MKHINIENIVIRLKMMLIRDESMICIQSYKKKVKKSIELPQPKTRFLGSEIYLMT